MTNRLSSLIFLGLLHLTVASVTTVWTRPVTTIRSSHDAAITAMAVQVSENRLFTAGHDGKLMVWHPATDRLLQTIRADRLPLQAIALFPDGDRVAIYASDGRREHRISVWNWKTGERLYLHAPDDEVLWMEISPQGSYLIYSVPDLRSMRMLDASTGRQLPFLRQSTGIVSWFITATSEERVMTYAPSSGAIAYRNVVTGAIDGRFQAPPDLKRFVLLEQRRYAAVETEAGLLGVLDLLSGDLVAEVRAGEIESIKRDPGAPDIIVLARALVGGKTIRRYRYENGRLQQRFETRRNIPDHTLRIVTIGRELYGADRNGTLLRWPPFENDPVEFAGGIIDPIRDLLFTDNRLYLLTAHELVSIASDFFGDISGPDRSVSFVDQQSAQMSVGAGARFLETNNDHILLWTPVGMNDARLHLFEPLSGRTSPLPVTIPPGVVSISAYRDDLVILTRAGLLSVINYWTGAETLSYRGAGLQTAIRSGREVFLGKAYEGGVLDSAILRIDPRTGQTVPMDTEARLVFALTYDHQRGRLFAVGVVESRTGDLNTVVEVFDGPNYGRRRTILEIPGEHLDAQVTVDPVRGTAYTTLDDRGGILRWDGARVSELARNQAHIPRRLVLSGDYVFSVNWDGTVSLIDRFDGNSAMDLVVIDSDRTGDWVALRPDGRFYASRPALASDYYFSINDDRFTLGDLIFEATSSVRPPRPSSQEDAPPAIDRFETGRSRGFQVEEETEGYDPEGGEPAPSS